MLKPKSAKSAASKVKPASAKTKQAVPQAPVYKSLQGEELVTCTKLVAYVLKIKERVPFLADGNPYDGVDCAKFAGVALTLSEVQIRAAQGQYGLVVTDFLADVRKPLVRALQWYTGAAHAQLRFMVRCVLDDLSRELANVGTFPGFTRCRDALDAIYTRNEVVVRVFAFDPTLYANYDRRNGVATEEMWLGAVTSKLETHQYVTIEAFCADLKLIGHNFLKRKGGADHSKWDESSHCVVEEFAHFICSQASALETFGYDVYVHDRSRVSGKGTADSRGLTFDFHRYRDNLEPGVPLCGRSEMFKMVGIDPLTSSVWKCVPQPEGDSPYARFIVGRVQEFLDKNADIQRESDTALVDAAWRSFNAEKSKEMQLEFYRRRAENGNASVVRGKGVMYSAALQMVQDIALVNNCQFLEFWGQFPTFERAVVQAAYAVSLQNAWIKPGAVLVNPKDEDVHNPTLDLLLAEVQKRFTKKSYELHDSKDAKEGDAEILAAQNAEDVRFVERFVCEGGETWEELKSKMKERAEDTKLAARVRKEVCERNAAQRAGVSLEAYRVQMAEAERVRTALMRDVRYTFLQAVEQAETSAFFRELEYSN